MTRRRKEVIGIPHRRLIVQFRCRSHFIQRRHSPKDTGRRLYPEIIIIQLDWSSQLLVFIVSHHFTFYHCYLNRRNHHSASTCLLNASTETERSRPILRWLNEVPDIWRWSHAVIDTSRLEQAILKSVGRWSYIKPPLRMIVVSNHY